MLDDKEVVAYARKWAKRFVSKIMEYNECFNIAYIAGKELKSPKMLDKCIYHTLLKFKESNSRYHVLRETSNCDYCDEVDREEVRKSIEEAKLSVEELAIINLIYVENLTQDKVANLLHCSQSTVSERLEIIITKIKRKIVERKAK